jgi:hypothetical protein
VSCSKNFSTKEALENHKKSKKHLVNISCESIISIRVHKEYKSVKSWKTRHNLVLFLVFFLVLKTLA